MISSDRSGRAFAAAQADILVRIFGECRGMGAIQLHYRAIGPLKFIICLALARVLVRGRARAVTNSIGVSKVKLITSRRRRRLFSEHPKCTSARTSSHGRSLRSWLPWLVSARRRSSRTPFSTILLPPGQSPRVNASYLQLFYFLHERRGHAHIHAPDRASDLQLDGASMDSRSVARGSVTVLKIGSQPIQHRGDGEILGRAAGRRAGLGGAVRADVPVPEVTI